MKVAIIGGTGVYDPALLRDVGTLDVQTRYGMVRITKGSYVGHDVFFLPRHGEAHSVPPHRINFRANIMSLRNRGRILSTAVGSLNKDTETGDLVVVDRYRLHEVQNLTFLFGKTVAEYGHTDPTPDPRKRAQSGKSLDDPNALIKPPGRGPRFGDRQRAKNATWRRCGESTPEVPCRRHLLCQATVTNWAAGISHCPTHEGVLDVVAAMWKTYGRYTHVIAG